MKTVEDVWALFKQLPKNEQSNLVRRAVEELDVEETADRRSLSFWDSLVVAVAKAHCNERILTEDGPSGAVVDGFY